VNNGKPRANGAVYRDEAADLMAAAARGTARPSPPELELTARRTKPEQERKLPYPEPVGINDNLDVPYGAPPAPRRRRRVGPLRIAARILIAPLYAAVAASAFGIVALFGKGLLGL
jgi:hypothetical protein